MKKLNLIYSLFFLFVLIAVQGCREDSFDTEPMDGKGTTFIKTPKGDVVVQWLSQFSDKRKLGLFNILKDSHNAGELSKVSSIKLIKDAGIIEKYNEENNTGFEELPASFYTWASPSNVSFSGNEATITFDQNNQFGDIDILLDGSKWTDIGVRYALAFKISDYGGMLPSETSTDTIIVQLGIKNRWDGVYKIVGTLTDASNGTIAHISSITDARVELHTMGETEVAMYDPQGYHDYIYPMASGTSRSGYGSFAPVFEIDKATNKVLSVTNLYGQPAGNTRSAMIDPSGLNVYDPETKTLYVRYFMLQPSVITAAPHIRARINEELSFAEER